MLPVFHSINHLCFSFRLARELRSEYDRSGLKITLYQYQTCPFCCKVPIYIMTCMFGLIYRKQLGIQRKKKGF